MTQTDKSACLGQQINDTTLLHIQKASSVQELGEHVVFITVEKVNTYFCTLRHQLLLVVQISKLNIIL